jgi:hypothetical protein
LLVDLDRGPKIDRELNELILKADSDPSHLSNQNKDALFSVGFRFLAKFRIRIIVGRWRGRSIRGWRGKKSWVLVGPINLTGGDRSHRIFRQDLKIGEKLEIQKGISPLGSHIYEGFRNKEPNMLTF